MANELEKGIGRLGWLIDGNAETPQVATLLQDDGQSITLTVPWPDGEGSPYEDWFTGRASPAPGLTTYSAKPNAAVPSQLWFYDVAGRIALVGCRPTGMHRQAFSHGQGHLDVRFTVLGGRGDYEHLHGLRSEVPELTSWVGVSGLVHSSETDERGRVKAVSMTVRSQEALDLGGPLQLKIRPTFQATTSPGDRATIQESMQVQTMAPEPRPWDDHLREHQSLRELVSVASWRPVGVRTLWAHRADDPLRDMSGREREPRWAEVRTYEVPTEAESVARHRQRYLFTFDDIGADGYTRWTELQRDFARAMGPLLSLVDRSMFLETRVIQSSIGFEALGFQLAREAGLSQEAANRERHEERLDRVVAALPGDLLDDLDSWAARSSVIYNGTKHAGRKMPSHLDQLNIERENEIVFRTWVAIRIGVDPEVLSRNL